MTEEELKLKAEQSVPRYMNTVERAIYISAYTDGFEECREENKNKFDRAKEIIKELLDFDFLPDIDIKKQAEQFLEEIENENSKR